jgi:hypothetical protein
VSLTDYKTAAKRLDKDVASTLRDTSSFSCRLARAACSIRIGRLGRPQIVDHKTSMLEMIIRNLDREWKMGIGNGQRRLTLDAYEFAHNPYSL